MKYKIAVFPGDGVGPELINEGMKVIDKAAELDKFEIEWSRYPHGSDHYNETKELLTEKLLREIKGSCSSIYCGPFDRINSDAGSNVPAAIREYFDQSIILRPIKLFPNVECPISNKTSDDINFAIIREASEDLYIGASGKAKNGKNKNHLDIGTGSLKIKFGLDIDAKGNEIAYQIGVISKKGCEKAIRYAFEYAKKNEIRKLISIDKANLMESYNFWRECFNRLANEYPDIEHEHHFVDAALTNLFRQPEKYKVIVAPNMFGDILGSLGTILQGGIAFGARGNINPQSISMFEPIHGSAPKLKGQGIVNPIATIWAGALMLENIGQEKSSGLIMKAITSVLKEGRTMTQDLGGSNTTSEIGDAVADKFVELHE